MTRKSQKISLKRGLAGQSLFDRSLASEERVYNMMAFKIPLRP